MVHPHYYITAWIQYKKTWQYFMAEFNIKRLGNISRQHYDNIIKKMMHENFRILFWHSTNI